MSDLAVAILTAGLLSALAVIVLFVIFGDDDDGDYFE